MTWTKLNLLTLVGLGSIWVCSWQAAKTANAGCAINCADWTMTYQQGVQPFWLHIAYHGMLGEQGHRSQGHLVTGHEVTWQRRVLGAMRLVLRTLLRGEDVVVHCAHGPQMEKVVCESKCLSQSQS